MKTQTPNHMQSVNLNPPLPASLKVRTGLRAGAWSCGNCVGTVSGSQMLNPTCELCRPA